MMRRSLCRAVVALAACVLVGVSNHAAARRAPSPGGTVVVSLPAELSPIFLEAHTSVPLVVPELDDHIDDGVHGPIEGASGYRSTIVAAMTTDAAKRRWRLRVRAGAADVAHSVNRCLKDRSERRFGAMALWAAGVQADAGVVGDDVVVTFSRAVGILPELLTWCPFRSPIGGFSGPYALQPNGRLAWRSGGFEAPPLLGAIEVRGPLIAAAPAERADVIVGPVAEVAAGATLLSPWPDVMVLVQREETAHGDPFGLRDDDGGLPAFRAALRADLLTAAWAAGRGGSTEQLLPPGVAPARPLPTEATMTPTSTLPLSLAPVPDNAPRVSLLVSGGDVLKEAVAERLAVLLRARKTLLDVRVRGDGADAELVRWRPPSRDAALSLLSFVGERDDIARDSAVEQALGNPDLLDDDDQARLAAALTLERALLHSRLVVPLLVVERTVTVDADLRGVVLRGDGVPLLDGAWWGGGR